MSTITNLEFTKTNVHIDVIVNHHSHNKSVVRGAFNKIPDFFFTGK